ncbi:MAG: hypothetical protein AB7S81_07945 [Bdellovibrionales bacterium]
MMNKKILIYFSLAAFLVTGCAGKKITDIRCQHLPKGTTCNIDPDNDVAAFPRFLYDAKTGECVYDEDGNPKMAGIYMPPMRKGVLRFLYEKPITMAQFSRGEGRFVAATFSEKEALAISAELKKQQDAEAKRLAAMNEADRKKREQQMISGFQLAQEDLEKYNEATAAKAVVEGLFTDDLPKKAKGRKRPVVSTKAAP